jgi:hypothetical protein
MLRFHAPKHTAMLHRAHRWADRRRVARQAWEASAGRTIARAGGTPPATWACRREPSTPSAARAPARPHRHLTAGR